MTGTTPSAAASPLSAGPIRPPSVRTGPPPSPHGPVDATVTVPGSKSLTNRYLVLAALADGPSRLRAPLHSRDSALMIEACGSWGPPSRRFPATAPSAPTWKSLPIGMDTAAADTAIDCGLAGTVMRFVPPVAALADGPVALRRRPARPHPPDGHQVLRGPARARRGSRRTDERPRRRCRSRCDGTGAVRGGQVTIDASRVLASSSPPCCWPAPASTEGVDRAPRRQAGAERSTTST